MSASPLATNPYCRDISFSLDRGQCLGLVGESGSGKSLTALSIMQLLPRQSHLSGAIHLAETNLAQLPERHLCNWRGNRMGMIFQEPMTALNPLKAIGAQVEECILQHSSVTRHEAQEQSQKPATTRRPQSRPCLAGSLPPPAFRRPASARRHRHGHSHETGPHHCR